MKYSFLKFGALYKNILKYSAILLILITIMVVIINQCIFVTLENNVINENKNNLEQVKTLTDSLIKDMQNIALHISIDRTLTPSNLKGNDYSSIEAINALKMYKVYNDYITDIFYFAKDDEKVYTSSQVCDLNYILKLQLNLSEKSYDMVNHYFNNYDMKIFTLNDQNTKNTFYIYHAKSSNNNYIIVFLLNNDKLYSFFNSMLNSNNKLNIVRDQDSNIIYSNKDLNSISNSIDETKTINMLVKKDDSFSKDNKEIITYTKSDKNQLNYISIMKKGILMGSMNKIKYKINIIAIIIFILGCFIIVYITYFNYSTTYKLNDPLTESIKKNNYSLRKYIIKELVKSKSYMQTNTVSKKVEQQDIIFTDKFIDICSQNDIDRYPYHKLNLFEESIKNGDIESADKNLKGIFDIAFEKDIPNVSLRCVILDIYNILTKTILDNGKNIKMIKYDYIDLGILNDLYNNRDKLYQYISNIYKNICSSITVEEDKKNKYFEDIIKYVNDNYDSQQFSVDNIGKYFDVSNKYINKIFKDKMQDTIMCYITKLRIEKAKNMLSDSDIPIKKIVSQLGYVDVSSFTRKFKNIEGVTPGRYREINNKKIAI